MRPVADCSSGPTVASGSPSWIFSGRIVKVPARPTTCRATSPVSRFEVPTKPATNAVAGDEHSAPGRIRAVVYLGPDTRYTVTLDAGSELVVTQQNLATTSTEALAQEGKAVRLIWKRQHELSVADGGPIVEEETP